jgi:hypothetical protein
MIFVQGELGIAPATRAIFEFGLCPHERRYYVDGAAPLNHLGDMLKRRLVLGSKRFSARSLRSSRCIVMTQHDMGGVPLLGEFGIPLICTSPLTRG